MKRFTVPRRAHTPHRQGSRLVPIVALVLCALAHDPSRAARRAEDAGPPSIVVQARALARAERDEGLALLEDYLGHDPDPALLPWVALEAGEQRRLANDLAHARAHFERVRACCPDSPLAEAATLGLTLVEAGETPSGNQLATLGLLLAADAPPSMDADRQRLLALQAAVEGDDARVRAAAARARTQAEASGDALVQARVGRALADLRQAVPGPAAAPPPTELGARALDEAWRLLEGADLAAARAAAEVFAATFPDSPRSREAGYVVRLADAGNKTDPRLVGVLLPLSGTYAPPGLKLRKVIELANQHSGSPMRLVFLDTAGDPTRVAGLLEDLVLERGAVAVLGPLLKDDATVAAETAQALHLPIVSLSQAEGITTDRPFVFRGFLTPVQQARALVGHTMGPMGLTRFAVLAPDTSYGRLAAEAFSAEVLQRGGEVQRQVFYDPASGDFRKPAAELAAKDYKARAGEFYRLKKAAEENGMDPDKVVLPPLVDFEAIFIPESHQRVPLVASALAYEEFAIGQFKPRREDVPLVLLGLNGWHHDRLAIDGGKYVRGGVFVDAFDPEDDAIEIRSFVEAFQQQVGGSPDVVDALGYDAARMVAAAVQAAPTTREGMRQALTAVELPDSVSGGRRFDEHGEVLRVLRVLAVGADRIVPWQPPEPPPEQAP